MLRFRHRRAVVPASFIQTDPTFANPWWTQAPVGVTPTGDGAPRDDRGNAVTETSTEIMLLDGRSVEHVRRNVVDANGRRRKEFLVRFTDGSVDSFDSIAHRLLPLHGLASLDANGVVVVTEGAKAADALHRRHIVAVGTLTGALGTPSTAALAVLAGRDVVLWPDNNEVGVRHMQRVAKRLAAIGVSSLRVARWVGAPRKADAADMDGDAAAFQAIIDAATPWSERQPVGGRGTVAINTGPSVVRLSLPADLRQAWGDDR